MIKAVLFDLDNTLIDINLAAFMARYMAGQARILSRVLRVAPPFASSAIIAAYLAMCSTRRTDALFNEELFHRVVERRLRRPFSLEPLAEVMQYYDSCYIERFKGGLVQACPRPGSHGHRGGAETRPDGCPCHQPRRLACRGQGAHDLG